MPILDRIAHAWNAFMGLDNHDDYSHDFGHTTYGANRPDRLRTIFGSERTIISSIYTRLALDAEAIEILHVKQDAEKRYTGDVDSGLNNCLTVEANIDQAARAFRRDAFLTLFDKGVVALVPVDTTIDPNKSGAFDIKTLRIGHVVAWEPQHVRVELYDERDGIRKQVRVEKKWVGLVENPLYQVMNEPNSTLQRLVRKLTLLDSMDEQVSSGKLDMIIQLPYVVKSEARRADAERRRTEVENQLRGSKYGIAYMDGTEKITQLNRPVENTLLKQVEWLTAKLYSELGLTPSVMDGTADEPTMNNYYYRTIEPLIAALVEEMRRKFLTKTARSQGQNVQAFRDPFRMVPVADLAEIVDKFSRNEVVAPNEFRAIMGMKPSKDPKSDLLINSNMPQTSPNAPQDALAPAPNVPTIDGEVVPPKALGAAPPDDDAAAHAAFDELEGSIDDILDDLGIR